MAQRKRGSLGGFYRSHHKLIWAAGVGLGVYAALVVIPNPLQATTRALIAWDALTASFIAIVFVLARNVTPREMARRASAQDEGRLLVLGVSLLSAAASLVAIWNELGAAKFEDGLAAQAHTGFAFATIALSWLFTHTVFASHYTHVFYAPDDDGDEGTTRRGLIFPGADDKPENAPVDDETDPDFWDFLHFALTIGVAMQTADIQIRSRAVRRVVTVHAVAGFLFNTVILAVSINFASSLFGG